MAAAGLYIHIPFCRAKCHYCDFASYAGLEGLHGNYVEALCQEIAHCATTPRKSGWSDARFDTIFIGGGTPTILPPSEIARVLATCRRELHIQDDAEITIEANPGTIDLAGLVALREAGVNRLSLGVQSLHDGELSMLGRIHNAGQAIAAYEMAREAGFEKVNLDLIFGLPAQDRRLCPISAKLESWRETLHRALELNPEHLSLYALSVEEGTPLARQIADGILPAPDDDLVADMYELAEAMLDGAGYAHYEISNWARRARDEDGDEEPPALACQHNLKYWTDQRYLGLGAAAHSYDGLRRWANVRVPAQYIERVLAGDDPIAVVEEMGRSRQMSDWMMLGLRLVAGVTWAGFERRFGTELRAVYDREIDELAEQGLLAVDARGVRLTARGRLLGNRAFAAFLR